MAADAIHLNGTQIHPDQPGLYGTRNVLVDGTEFPDVPETLFLQDNPTKDGQILLGSWAGARPFTIVVFTDLGATGTEAKGKDEAAALNRLCSPVQSLVEFKVVRDNPAGGSYSRVLKATPVGRAHWQYTAQPGGLGVRPSGNLRWQREFVAPYPWWRNATATPDSFACSGTSPNSKALARTGDLACGLKVSISTTGTLPGITLFDGVNTMVLVASFSGTAKWVDWHHTIPGQVDWSPGIAFAGRPHLELHSDPTTITATPAGGSSGTHTVGIDWFPLWEMA